MELKELNKRLINIEPFKKVPIDDLSNLTKNSFLKTIEIGEQIIEFNKIPEFLPVLLNGSLRLLVFDEYQNPITLSKLEIPQLIGWSTVLRGNADISIIASSESEILFIPTMQFISLIHLDCIKKFISRPTLEEIYSLVNLRNSREGIPEGINKKNFLNWFNDLNFNVLQIENQQQLNNGDWLISSSNFVNYSMGEIINSNNSFKLEGKLPGRLIPLFDLPSNLFNKNKKTITPDKSKDKYNDLFL